MTRISYQLQCLAGIILRVHCFRQLILDMTLCFRGLFSDLSNERARESVLQSEASLILDRLTAMLACSKDTALRSPHS